MRAALKRVEGNKGVGGIDGVELSHLRDLLRECCPQARAQLLEGSYRPTPVRRVEIPKPGGGARLLGIPTVLDRLIQQAVPQVSTLIFDPSFSDSSYGFRPGRRAHDARRRARQYVAEGHDWVVDLDIEKFFDRVNHDILMSRMARKVADRRVLRLTRRYRGRCHGQWGGGPGGRRDTAGWPAESVCLRKIIKRVKDRIGAFTSRSKPVSMEQRIQRINACMGGWPMSR